MYIIVIGCGRAGSRLAKDLADEGHNVVVVDKDPASFRRLGSTFNGMTIEGMGSEEDVLIEAGIEKADAVAAVTDWDDINLMAVEIATKIFGVNMAIARLYNPDKEKTYQRLGLEYVCGAMLVAGQVLDKIVKGRIRHIPVGSDAEIIEFEAAKGLENKGLTDIEIPGEVKVSAIIRKGETILPNSSTSIQENDRILCAVRRSAVPKINRFIKS